MESLMLRCIVLLAATLLCHGVLKNHESGKAIPGIFVKTLFGLQCEYKIPPEVF